MVKDGQDFPSPGVMHEGADGTGRDIRDKLALPSDNEKRRKFFLEAKNRQSFVFEKGRTYSGVSLDAWKLFLCDGAYPSLGLLQRFLGFWQRE